MQEKLNEVEHLIEKFVPENYKLFLDINRKERKFCGAVKIKGKAKTKNISLHQKALEIKAVKCAVVDLKFAVDNEKDAVSIELNSTGNLDLFVEFSGIITDNMTGIYPSYYIENGEKKEVIATMFASHFARQLFPCIDEPAAKASYDLSIKFDQQVSNNNSKNDEVVISNMPEIQIEERKNTGVWKFKTTPRMSSYLLAFAIGNLQNKMAKTKNGTEVGVFSTKAHPLKTLDFALDIAIKAIEFYENYFGVNYPIPHSYHLALPDFSAGAMENWGLITYREVNFLVDDNSTVGSRQRVALVIAHEVSHQWFGNLVTMKWWNDLWLNESFAKMMEYVAIESIKPEWNIIENFQTEGAVLALTRDATAGVQSVQVPVHHPDEVNSLFDGAIVYAKGSRLMHMVRRWLGDANFSKGLGNYFARFKYSNTVGKDLWSELNKVSGKDVEGFMQGWLNQSGYPVVNVKIETNTLVISQKQFNIGKKEDKKRLWHIPLNSNWKGLPEMLSKEKIEISNYSQLKSQNENSVTGNGKALRLNTGNTAHYIVNYEGELFDKIHSEFEALDKISKLQFIQDLKFLAEGNEITYSKLIGLLPLIKHEKSYIVNTAASNIISNIKQFLDLGSEAEKAFKKIVKSVFQSKFDRLGFIAKNGETDDDEIVRHLALSAMLYAEDETTIKQASEIFAQYNLCDGINLQKNKLEAIPAGIRDLILVNEIRHNESEGLVKAYFNLYEHAIDSNFKQHLSAALAETKNKKTVDQAIAIFQNKDIIKPQDLAMSWYGKFLGKDFAQEKAWTWARKNWDWIYNTLGGDLSFDKFVIYPAMHFKTQKRLQEYKEFFTPKLSDVSISRPIEMGITQIEARIKLLNEEKTGIEKAILEF